MRGSREDLRDKVREQLERSRQLERDIRALRDRLASGRGVDLAAGAIDVQGVKVVATKVDGADVGALRTAVDELREERFFALAQPFRELVEHEAGQHRHSHPHCFHQANLTKNRGNNVVPAILVSLVAECRLVRQPRQEGFHCLLATPPQSGGRPPTIAL